MIDLRKKIWSDTMNTPNIEIIKASSLKTSPWSGGTTSQIAISPKDGDYNKRSFDWRISTATVEVSESSFTPLKGVKRFITSLSGDLKLVHDDHHTICLRPFEVDVFYGDWNTTSFGKVTDFNLMIKGDYTGDLHCPSIKANVETPIQFESFTDANAVRTLGIYAGEHPIQCHIDHLCYPLERGDLLLATTNTRTETDTDLTLNVYSKKDTHVCVVELSKI